MFNWLIFSNEFESFEKFTVPYFCEFIIANRVNNYTFKLIELYKLKNKIISYDFAMWNNYSGLNTTNLSMLRRRMNLNNTELLWERFSFGKIVKKIYIKKFFLF